LFLLSLFGISVIPARRAKHEIGFMLAALVDVRTSATVPAEHNATFRAFNLGILMHSESGMFAAAFIDWHIFIVLLS
jgi:hypothetical protein